jgi:hypothetical protein
MFNPTQTADPTEASAAESDGETMATSVAGLSTGARNLLRGGVKPAKKNKRKAKRTPEEIARAEDAAAVALAGRVKKASDKAAAVREKAAAKRARDLIKAAEAAAKESSNKQKWTDDSSLQLLAMVKGVKDEYLELKAKTGGFMKFTQFFGTRENQKMHFPLLVNVTTKAMWSRYQAIMVIYRVSQDLLGFL